MITKQVKQKSLLLFPVARRMWFIHISKYFKAIKKNKVLSYIMTWMNFTKNIEVKI